VWNGKRVQCPKGQSELRSLGQAEAYPTKRQPGFGLRVTKGDESQPAMFFNRAVAAANSMSLASPQIESGFNFLLAVILFPAFLLSGRDALARRRAHGASLLGRCRRGSYGSRFAAQLPPDVGDLFCELRRLVLISDQCSFQERMVVCGHRPKFIIGSHQ